MATTASPGIALDRRLLIRPLSAVATAGLLGICGIAIAIRIPHPSPLVIVAVLALLSIVVWMVLSERYAWSLAILMLYLGLADGYLKLRTGSSSITLLRDVLLYAIAAGALVRAAVREERVRLPPLSGWIVAWLVVVGIQVFNPHDGTTVHSLAAIRPHAEWVPLFFLGYAVMRSKQRLRRFLLLLLVVAAGNGVVGLVQLNLTPEQLSSWGPGYKEALSGEGGVSKRTFATSTGEELNRPFALGGDFGFGGIVGLIAIPAAMALLTLERNLWMRLLVALLSAGAVLGVVTSEARTAVLGAVIAGIAFAALTVTSKVGMRSVLALVVTGIVVYATIGVIGSGQKQGSFERYGSINSPGKALTTAYQYRQATFAKIPIYAAAFPFGAGIGSTGPGASFGGRGSTGGLDGESEPTYLLIEVGVPGLLVMLGFNLMLFYVSIARIRKIQDHEARILLTGVAAPLFAIFVTWFVGVTTATTPCSPYMWLAAGTLSFWLLGDGYRTLRTRTPLATSRNPAAAA